jgi:pyruvate, orthophosphate dikinase
MAQSSTQGGATPHWVYQFGTSQTDGHAGLADRLGGKGANLAEMARLGLPVPPGFTIATDVSAYYVTHGETLPDGLVADVEHALAAVGVAAGAIFGDADNPLLLAVRSGSRASMPGMMDTILNIGLNQQTVEGLAKKSGDARFAYDSYRRFIEMYSDVVLGVDHGIFADLLDNYKNLNGLSSDTDLTAQHWLDVIAGYMSAVESQSGEPFPQDTTEQLRAAIKGVFGSWQNERAVTYRRLHAISDDWGTSVTVQAMVFGNMGATSATGVAFTRNPSTGERALYGEFLPNAQGEDVVAGIRTPQPLTKAARLALKSTEASLEEAMPGAFSELSEILSKLETHYRDMQDVEFTIQDNKVWMLQTRNGKRSTEAGLKIAVDMASEGIISREDAVLQIDAGSLANLLHPRIDASVTKDLITRGLPASPGAASGEIVLSPDDAEVLRLNGARRLDEPCSCRRSRDGIALRVGCGCTEDRYRRRHRAGGVAVTLERRRDHDRRFNRRSDGRARAHAPAGIV